MLKQEIKNCFFYGVPTYGDGGVKPVGTISEHQPMMVMMLMTVMVMMMIVSSATARDWGSGDGGGGCSARAGFLQVQVPWGEPPRGLDRDQRVRIAI